MGRPVRLLVANDHEIIVRGLVAMLAPFADRVAVVATAAGDGEIPRRAGDTGADVVLIDTFLRPHAGIEVAEKLRSECPALKVVIFTYEDGVRPVREALGVGVAGYLHKSLAAPDLVGDLERVVGGDVVVDPEPASGRRRPGGWPGGDAGLSRREGEILTLLVEGATNRQMAGALYISEETVKSHLRSLYRKLDVGDRASAVSAAWRRGIFPA